MEYFTFSAAGSGLLFTCSPGCGATVQTWQLMVGTGSKRGQLIFNNRQYKWWGSTHRLHHPPNSFMSPIISSPLCSPNTDFILDLGAPRELVLDQDAAKQKICPWTCEWGEHSLAKKRSSSKYSITMYSNRNNAYIDVTHKCKFISDTYKRNCGT